MSACIKITVSGRVQGVYFRAFTQKEAQKLDLTGWVRNLPNSDVEIMACGDKISLDALVRWCHQGPQLARVDKVVVEPCEYQTFFDFEIIR